jgi:hypothetical protein
MAPHHGRTIADVACRGGRFGRDDETGDHPAASAIMLKAHSELRTPPGAAARRSRRRRVPAL